MIIQINDDIKISQTDSKNITVQRRLINEVTKEPYWVAKSHHGSLRSALAHILDDSSIVCSIETVQQFNEWLDRIEKITKELNA